MLALCRIQLDITCIDEYNWIRVIVERFLLRRESLKNVSCGVEV